MKHRGIVLSTRLLLVLANILLAFVVFYFFLKRSHHALYETTGHGDEYVVANYENATLSDAVMSSSLQGFQFVVVDSIYDPSYPKGVIIKQNPRPGSRVKRNRKIYVNITTSSVPIREVDFGDFDRMEKTLQRVSDYYSMQMFPIDTLYQSVCITPGSKPKVLELRHKNKVIDEPKRIPLTDTIQIVVEKPLYRFYNAPQLISLPFSAAMDVYNQWSSQIIEDNCGVQLKVYVQLNGFEKPLEYGTEVDSLFKNGLLSENEYYAIDDYVVVFQSHFNKGSLVDASKAQEIQANSDFRIYLNQTMTPQDLQILAQKGFRRYANMNNNANTF